MDSDIARAAPVVKELWTFGGLLLLVAGLWLVYQIGQLVRAERERVESE